MKTMICFLLILIALPSISQAYDPKKMQLVHRYTNPATKRQIEEAREVQFKIKRFQNR